MKKNELLEIIKKGENSYIEFKEEVLNRLFESNGSIHYDISPVPNSSIKDLNLDVIREYYLRYNAFDLHDEDTKFIERILINADILKESYGKAVCSVGGLLMFGKNADLLLPQDGVSFAHFRGIEIADELIDRKVILGRIQDIAEQVMTVLNNNMILPSVIKDLKREDHPEYPILVLREAIVNSLVHRNYSIAGSKIRIFMFEDRIEFHSPGKLPNTVTNEKMKIGVSYARNPFLVKYMENLRYIDQLGRGIPMILKTMKDIGAKEPLLKEIGEEFILTIYKK